MAAKSIYLDYNATTPVHPLVLECMLPYFSHQFGNASSKLHAYGWMASEAVEVAREQVAHLIGASTAEITFTSGATEALNTAIKGIAHRYISKGKHIISFPTEHKAVLESLEYLAENGWEVQLLPVNASGLPDLDALKESMRNDTVMLAAMLANNESGVIWPIAEMAALAKEKGCLLLCDATQACGKIPVDVNALGVDVLALSAHKFYGPKGAGALYARRRNPRVSIAPLLHGGGHENGMRSGTLNVPAIVGMGKAAEIASSGIAAYQEITLPLRDQIERELMDACKAEVFCKNEKRLSNTSLIRFPGMLASRLIPLIPNLAFSTGSACSSALPTPSHVLKAMGCTNEQAFETVRLTLGNLSQEEDIQHTIDLLKRAIITSL